MIIDNATPMSQGHLPGNTRITALKEPIVDEDRGISVRAVQREGCCQVTAAFLPQKVLKKSCNPADYGSETENRQCNAISNAKSLKKSLNFAFPS